MTFFLANFNLLQTLKAKFAGFINLFHLFKINIFEYFFNIPFISRDYILRAKSEDGLKWKMETNYRFKPKIFFFHYMSYFVFRWNEALFFGLHIHNKDTWYLKFYGVCTKKKVVSNLPKDILSPCVIEDNLYFLRRGSLNLFQYNLSSNGVIKTINLNLPKDTILVDQYLMYEENKYFLFLTKNIDSKNRIFLYTSETLEKWNFNKVLFPSAPFHIINNPCVIKHLKGWRMYFRGGVVPNNDNCIYSAFSKDMINWTMEKGSRIRPAGKWAKHGVGFPFVYYDKELNSYVMYFTGYWGDSLDGDKTYIHYLERFKNG